MDCSRANPSTLKKKGTCWNVSALSWTSPTCGAEPRPYTDPAASSSRTCDRPAAQLTTLRRSPPTGAASWSAEPLSTLVIFYKVVEKSGKLYNISTHT